MESIIQAYSNTPRRKQLKILGGFFLGLIVLVVLLISYLIVSSRIVSVGRDLQNTKNKIDDIEYVNVSLRDKISSATTLAKLESQAKEQGFRPAQPSEVLYVVVPGLEHSYNTPVGYKAESQIAAVETSVNVNIPAYHTTLLDWMKSEMAVFLGIFEGYEQ